MWRTKKPKITISNKPSVPPGEFRVKLPTNADRIRSMSDDELARDRVYSKTFEDGRVFWYGDFEGYCIYEELAIKLESDWLSQPAEED